MKAEILSAAYRGGRAAAVAANYWSQDLRGQTRDLEPIIDFGDKLLHLLPAWAAEFSIPRGIGAQLYDLKFESPLTLAAFKHDVDVIEVWMKLGLGGACVKTVMKEPRPGNARPRVQDVEHDGHEGLLNAMGLPGPGMEETICELERSNLFSYGRPIGISVGGSSITEYQHNIAVLSQHFHFNSAINRQGYFEINVSCPNTPDGQQITKNPEKLHEVLQYARQWTPAVIGVKISPDTPYDKLVGIIDVTSRFTRTFINAGNTTLRKCPELGLPENAISIGQGGYSGPELYPRTLEMLKIIKRHSGIPVISTGGVDSADKVKELLDNGATAVGMATAVVKDMYCIPRINYELARRAA